MCVLNPEKAIMASHFKNKDQEFNLKSFPAAPVGDYSGTVAKDDPAEPTLVRKIDWRIMPTLWCMYFMNYVRLSLLPASHDAGDGS
jgi:hypothetical protein